MENSQFNWLNTRQIELRQLFDIEMQQKKALLTKVNELNEILFLYKNEELLLKNFEQLFLLKIYIDSDAKIENYDFFNYCFNVLKNVKDTISIPQVELYSRGFQAYFSYLNVVLNEINDTITIIEQILQSKYDFYLNNMKNSNYQTQIDYSWTTIAEKFSIKCSGHLERISLMKAYDQDWKICKVCHAFICPTCGSNLESCPNLARSKHKLELIGLPLENIINFLQTERKTDDNFIIMDKEVNQNRFFFET